MKQLGYSPKDLDLRSLRRLPEERIAGAVGVPASLAQLGAGTEKGSALGGNVRRSEMEWMTESKSIPWYGAVGRQLTRQLFLPDYGTGPADPRYIRFPTNRLRALQEDTNAVAERLRQGVATGAVMVSEYRRELGLPVGPEHEVFLRGASTMTTDASGVEVADVEDE